MADKFGIKEVMDVVFYDITTNEPVLYLDTLKMTNLENTAESVDARGGKGNPKLITWDYNREATFAIQDALMSMESFNMMTGNDAVVTSAEVHKRESLVVEAAYGGGAPFTVTLTETPLDDENGDARLNILDADGAAVVIDSLVGKEATLTGVAEGDTVVAYYFYTEALAQAVTINSDKFPGTYKIIGDTLARNTDGVDEAFQIVVERAKIQPGFTLTMEAEGDPSVFDMNITVLKPADSTNMVKMIKY